MGTYENQMENSNDDSLSGSDKLVYLMEGLHNRKFYTTTELCSLPPKDFVLCLTNGTMEGHRKYRPIRTQLTIYSMIDFVKSKV